MSGRLAFLIFLLAACLLILSGGCGGCTVTFYNRQDNQQAGCPCQEPTKPAAEPAKGGP